MFLPSNFYTFRSRSPPLYPIGGVIIKMRTLKEKNCVVCNRTFYTFEGKGRIPQSNLFPIREQRWRTCSKICAIKLKLKPQDYK